MHRALYPLRSPAANGGGYVVRWFGYPHHRHFG